MSKSQAGHRQVGQFIGALLLWPFVGIFAVLGIRFARISNPGRIGHLAAEIDCFLRERALGLIPASRPILLLERKKAANTALLDLIGNHVTVWDRRWQKVLFTPFTKVDGISLPLGRPILGFGECTRYPQVLALWGDRSPPIALTDRIQRRGEALLQELGVPRDSWFVCLHAREGGYSPRDEESHAHRNSDIETYRLAIEAITARGGWVVRVGDASMRPLEAMPNVIDYARSPLKADWMDIWLCANNRFFLGNSSGLMMVAAMYHRPCALANMAPLGSIYGMGKQDISIGKKTLGSDGTALGFEEIFSSGLSAERYAWRISEQGVQVVDNTPEEIGALVIEMMARLDGHFETSEEDEDLQLRFRALLRPNDNCFGSPARVGRDWLRENHSLL